MKATLKGLAHRFWAIPLLFAIAASLVALGVTAVDESLDTSLRLPFLFAGGPEGARALLAAIITSMISFTGLVFSITIVVLQLTSSQFSPRVLRSAAIRTFGFVPGTRPGPRPRPREDLAIVDPPHRRTGARQIGRHDPVADPARPGHEWCGDAMPA